MDKAREQRSEQRLCYNWPIRFAKGFDEALSRGQMVNISSWAVAFTCRADRNCPEPGQQITTLFSVPRFGPGGSLDMANYTRRGRIRRVDKVNESLRRVAIQFAEPLFFKPGEQDISEFDAQRRLETVTV